MEQASFPPVRELLGGTGGLCLGADKTDSLACGWPLCTVFSVRPAGCPGIVLAGRETGSLAVKTALILTKLLI